MLSATVFLTRLAGALTRSLVATDRSRLPGATIVLNIARFVIWVIGFMVVLNLLGVDIGALLTALGVTGIAVSLGLQDIPRNLFTGLQITLTHEYEPGQFVHLQSGEEGEVIDLTWRETRLRTPTGDIAVVPNSVIGNTVVTNYARGDELYVLAVEFEVARATAGASAEVEASSPRRATWSRSPAPAPRASPASASSTTGVGASPRTPISASCRSSSCPRASPWAEGSARCKRPSTRQLWQQRPAMAGAPQPPSAPAPAAR